MVIKVDDLGKVYLISHAAAERERYVALRNVLALSRASPGDGSVEEFRALKDLSFKIRER